MIRRRQDIHARAIEQFLLQAILAFTLRKLLVHNFPVESDDMRRELFQLLRKNDASLGEIFARQFRFGFRRTFYEVGESYAKFDHALVVVIVERLGHNAAFVKNVPELIGAPGIVVADTHGGFAWIATDDDQLHAFSEMVGECSHIPSVAYFECGVPEFRAGRSQRSRSVLKLQSVREGARRNFRESCFDCQARGR